MKVNGIVIGLFLSIFIFGCSNNTSSPSVSASALDEQFFDAAKVYLNEPSSFGSQTNVSNPNNITVEFDNSVIHPPISTNLAYLVSEKKEFILNDDSTLLMMKRKLPSSLDGKRMKVTMRQGIESYYKPGIGRYKTRPSNLINHCDRVVVNSVGRAVCLNKVSGAIELTRFAEKFGNRMISSCYKAANYIYCNGHYGVVSRKTVLNGEIIDRRFRNRP